jgi:hypothetical protein
MFAVFKNRTILFTLVAFLFSASTFASCSFSTVLSQDGWKVHSAKQFNRLSQEVLANIEGGIDSGLIIPDMKGTFYNRNGVDEELHIKVQSWDDLTTPQSEMFGDIAVMTEAFSGTVVEVRWYEAGVKNVVFDLNWVTCMVHTIPYAINSIL